MWTAHHLSRASADYVLTREISHPNAVCEVAVPRERRGGVKPAHGQRFDERDRTAWRTHSPRAIARLIDVVMTGLLHSCARRVSARSSSSVVLAALIGVAAGLAAWCTLGVLDLTSDNGRLVPVAMLPSLRVAASLTGVGAAACALFVWTWTQTAGRRGDLVVPAHDVLVPLLGTLVLVLPYVPPLPQHLPAVTILAGPLKYIVWTVAFTLSLHAVVPPDALLFARGRVRDLLRRSPTLLVLVTSVLVLGVTAHRLTTTALYPGGDEPHYLVIAQSLWRDGDLRIENNHLRGDTLEYYPRELAPHYLARGRDHEIYSVHPVALSFLAAPFYAAGGYGAVVALMVAMAACTSVLMWHLALDVTRSGGAATFGWIAAAFTAPFVFNSFAIYPEIPAGLALMVGYALARGAGPVSPAGARRWALCGTMVAALPWLSTKYAVLAAALAAVALARIWMPASPEDRARDGPTRLASTVALSVPPILGLAGWFLFFWIIWGTVSPSAPYGTFRTTELATMARGVPGLWFDQEYGLLPVAPVLALALVGLLGMLREPSRRRTAIEAAAMVVSLLLSVGGFNLWWGGSAAVGRPMIAALPLLSAPIAWRFHRQGGSFAMRAAYLSLLVVSLAIVVILATVYNGLLLVTQKDGTGPLLEWASPSWNVAALAPSFIVGTPWEAMRVVLVWVGLCAGAGLVLRRTHLRRGRAGLLAMVTAAGVVGAASLIVPSVVGGRVAPVSLLTRPEVRLLNDFSPSRRPIAIRYAPFDRIDPRDVPALFRFVARPGDMRSEPPLPLLYKARWSLPAGRYGVELLAPAGVRAASPARLALQLGRLGSPAEEWDVVFDPNGRWATTFTLPIGINSVGFKGSAALESLEPALVLQPMVIDDIRGLPPAREVLRTVRYGNAQVFFHDESMTPEARGFWTRGGASSPVTLAWQPRTSQRLRVESGPIGCGVHLLAGRWRQGFTLAPNESRDVLVPAIAGRVLEMQVETAVGFVPSELDPRSVDRRRLGCWVGVVP